jgi:hypothetical protein
MAEEGKDLPEYADKLAVNTQKLNNSKGRQKTAYGELYDF